MVKIINPMYGTDPVASAFSGIGKSLFGGGDTSDAINREQLRKLQRENVENEAFSRLVLDKGGVQGLGADPMAQALMIANGYSPNDFGRLGAIGAATGGGIEDPNTSEWLVGMGEGASSPWNLNANRDQQQGQFDQTLAQQIAADEQASLDRRYGVDRTTGESHWQFLNTPEEVLNATGAPDFASRGDVVSGDYAPILPLSEVQGTAAAPLLADNGELAAQKSRDQLGLMGFDRNANANDAGTVKNLVTRSGNYLITDESYAQGKDAQGRPLPTPQPDDYVGAVNATSGSDLTNAVQTDLQSDLIAKRKFDKLVELALPLTSDPRLFGPVGMASSAAQNLFQTINGAAEALDAREILASTLTDKNGTMLGADVAARLIPELYDPRLSEVETLWGLLVYQGAMALAGQQGRSVSDADVLQMRNILGDPQGFFSSNLAMRTKLQIAQKVVDAYAAVTEDVLSQDGVTPGAPTPDAAPVPVQTPEDAAKLPKGTKFVTPDGRTGTAKGPPVQ